MQPLSYKEFIKQVKNRLSKMSKADLDDMILHWAEKELPSNRPNFIGKMIIPEPGNLNTADGEALLGEIDAFTRRVENGDYCIGWGWDNDIYDERDWGDESWAEEAEVISSLGERLNDSGLMLEGYQESFYSKPSSKHLIDLYSTAIDCKCFETVRDQVEQRAWELYKQDKGLVTSYYHSDLSRSHLPEGLLYRILILGVRHVKLFELCKRKGSLGWSGGNNPKPYFINYTMVLLSDNGKYTKVINNEWGTLLTNSAYVVDSNLTDKYNKIIAHTSNNIELTEEQKAFYLQWCSKEIGKRVDAIIGNQYRKSYYKAANLLVAMAE